MPFRKLLHGAQEVTRLALDTTPTDISIGMLCGGRIEIKVPPNLPDEESDVKIESPGCAADVVYTLRLVGHRMTKEALLAEMAKNGRKWSASPVEIALAQFAAIGFVDNRQDVKPNGYGVVGED